VKVSMRQGMEKTLAPVLTMRTEEPPQCCFAGLLAMEKRGEDRFERDERLRIRNPAGWMVVSSSAASAPPCETSLPATGSLI
jgi:hypothetical protein